MNSLFGAATTTPSPITQASSSATPLYANVPMKWFVIMFVVLLAVFLAWYIYMRNRGY